MMQGTGFSLATNIQIDEIKVLQINYETFLTLKLPTCN